jgi:serine/threonine protein kinase
MHTLINAHTHTLMNSRSHRELRHPSILLFYGATFVRREARELVCIVTELCTGSLDYYLQKHANTSAVTHTISGGSSGSGGGGGSGSSSSSSSSSSSGTSYRPPRGSTDTTATASSEEEGAVKSMPDLTNALLVRLMTEIAAGLAFMHSRGVIHRYTHKLMHCADALHSCTHALMHSCTHSLHRDLKPHNILMSVHGTAKLADFGLSKILGTGSESQARTAAHTANVGSPAYMAPELFAHDGYVQYECASYGVHHVAYVIHVTTVDHVVYSIHTTLTSRHTHRSSLVRYSGAVDVYALGIILNALW